MDALPIITRFFPKRIDYLKTLYGNGVNFKVYGVTVHDRQGEPEVMKQAMLRLGEFANHVDMSALQHYRAGFYVIHETEDMTYASLNWWVEEHVLANRVYACPADRTDLWVDCSARNIRSTVWEMALWFYERNAWISRVLIDGADDYRAYLNMTYKQQYL